MTQGSGAAIWYRSRATLARRWTGCVVLALIIGLVGGAAMASIEFARRTQSSYPAYLKQTNASDLTLSTYGTGNSNPATAYSPATERAIARLPGVARVESWAGVFAVPLEPSGAPELSITRLNGPGLVFVRMRPGVSLSAAQRDMQRLVQIAGAEFATDPNGAGDGVTILAVQRPAEIVNYQATGDTPEVLAAALAGGAVLALALVLTDTVRKRRSDLAMLKTLGLRRRALVLTLIWQATAVVVGGIVIGVPLGIALGRALWDLFAENIGVVPASAVPSSIAVVALGAIVFAVLVALLPGLAAASTPPAAVLREE